MQLDRSKLILLAAGLAVVGLGLWLWPTRAQTPEDRIRHQVEQMAEAAGKRDLGFILEQISEQFAGQGGADKAQLKGILAAQMFRGEFVEVVPLDLEVTLEGESQATFSGKFLFARKAGQDLAAAAEAGSLTGYRIDATLVREADGEWRFRTAEHGRLGGADLFP